MSVKIGFIFSLPRAGSTYVQRVLSSADSVVTIPEPWLMPALFGILSGPAPLAEFAYDHVRVGLNETLARLPDGRGAWNNAISAMSQRLYGEFAREGEIFFDKTPRNAVFCEEIIQAFEDARFLFLWRNPLSVVSSINRTWGDGHWKAYFYEYDLYKGLPSLVTGFQAHAEDPRVAAVRYEDLVADPDTYWPRVFSHFDLEYNADAIKKPPKMLSTMGDRSGQETYSQTSAAPIENWKNGFGNTLRRRWARRYLEYIGDGALETMGYNKSELLNGITETKGDWKFSDYLYLPFSPIYHRLELQVIRSKFRQADGFFARR